MATSKARPWTAEPDAARDGTWLVRSGAGELVACLLTEQDAKLIAGAVELYVAAQMAIHEEDGALAALRSAYAKAGGL
jgi:hypothetical protein